MRIVPSFKTTFISNHWLSGGVITQASGTQINISAGSAYFYDINTKQKQTIIWNNINNLTLTNIALLKDSTYILIDINSNIIQNYTHPTSQDIRNYIFLGKISHRQGTDISNILQYYWTEDISSNDYDLADKDGSKNITGNIFSPFDANLQIKKSAGQSFRFLANSSIDLKNPHFTTEPELNPVSSLNRVYRNNTGDLVYVTNQTTVDPTKWDNGSGILQAVPSNKWTIQHIHLFPKTNSVYVFYGQNLYNSFDEAVNATKAENFVHNFDFFEGSTLRTYLITKNTTTNLNNIGDALFINI